MRACPLPACPLSILHYEASLHAQEWEAEATADAEEALMDAECICYYSKCWRKAGKDEQEWDRAEAWQARRQEMWMVHCLPYKATAIAEQVDDRLSSQRSSHAFSVQSLPGCIYVVASSPKERACVCEGVLGLYANLAVLIPMDKQAMVAGMYADHQAAPSFHMGERVHPARGVYRDCLGRVCRVEDRTDKVVVAVVPFVPVDDGERLVRKPFTLMDAVGNTNASPTEMPFMAFPPSRCLPSPFLYSPFTLFML